MVYVVVEGDVIGGVFFFFNDTATTEIYTLSLHDALPISLSHPLLHQKGPTARCDAAFFTRPSPIGDRPSFL